MAESEADVQQDAALPIAHRKSKKSSQKCRFFNSRNGCRAGSECRFSHDTTFEEKPNEVTTTAGQTAVDGESGRKYKQPLADKRRVISRPIPKAQAEDPRESQLGQIRRRFNPSEEVGSSGTVFKFGLVPSDPDFPFEIDSLSCILTVPFGYPQSGLPSIRVTNQELRRGFQLNIERGFEDLVASSPGATLLGLFNRLDKELENLLSKEMSETVKLVLPPRPKYTESIATEQKVITVSRATVKPVVQEALVFFTSEQKNAASTKRQTEIRQIIARLGRLKGFIKHADESTFTIPFEPTKKTALPDSLRTQQNLRLFVPALYNLHPPQVEFPGNTGDEARRLGKAFQQRAKLHPELTLLAHVNYLSHNVHVMMAEVEQDVPKNVVEIEEPQADVATSSAVDKSLQIDAARPTDKDHVRLIERPPEWAQHSDGQDDYSSDESASTDYESDDEPLESGVIGDATASSTPTIAVERGVQISFPDLGLHCIELLELVTLNIVVKCDRCKETTEFLRLKNNAAADQTGMKDENCKKCSNSLAVGYRMDLMHANSSRAGYLDMDGCTVVDMLPSHFIPTCSDCSTPFPGPGVVAVRGDAAMAICRDCHQKMMIRIPEIKFLRVSAAAARLTPNRRFKKAKENLGIVAGQELPGRGRCKHYAKSYRWFRFSCCQRVFPCDRCHDEASDHPEEHANRMLCGYCSREQNYAPEQCHFCHSILVGKRGHGFWEGGKGTRDRVKMSRKDPRKYKRPGTKT